MPHLINSEPLLGHYHSLRQVDKICLGLVMPRGSSSGGEALRPPGAGDRPQNLRAFS